MMLRLAGGVQQPIIESELWGFDGLKIRYVHEDRPQSGLTSI